MNLPVFRLDQVTVARAGRVVLDGLSWTVREGEAWAVTGPIGSGKTTLAETLLGKHVLRGGSVEWPLLDRLRAAGRPVTVPSDIVRHVAFREDSRLFSYAGQYYQQRWEFADADAPLTLEQFLQTGSDASADLVQTAAERLGIVDKLSLAFIKLSNGQARRARVARALLARPELLILDDPFMGVDAAGRGEIADHLGRLVREGLRLVLICGPEAVPGWVTGVLELNQTPPPNPLPAAERGLGGGVFPEPVLELRNVTVAHGGRAILSGVDWTVRAGERWAVVGPNGSGKSTLLALLCGDHPQAFAQDVRLFGRRRGTGETLWDVKRRVGLVSPEFHLYFGEPLTAGRAAATGFFDGVADRPTTAEQDAAVGVLFDEFGIAHLRHRPFRQLSTGEQRLVLLVRALVKRPPLLILDEPFQGLDRAAADRARDWLDRNLSPEQTLLFVSHHEEEIPRTVTRRLRLDGGRVLGGG